MSEAPRSQDHVDRTADMVERRVNAAALAIQQQFLAITKQIDSRVDGNREQSEARLDALDALAVTRSAAVREYAETLIRGLRERNDERWEGFKTATIQRADQSETLAQQRNDQLQELFLTKIHARDQALELQAREYGRRLEVLNHAYEREQKSQEKFVRNDIYVKDMERLYTERQSQIAQAENARVTAEAATAANRRSSTTAIAAGALSLLGLLVTVALRFVPSH